MRSVVLVQPRSPSRNQHPCQLESVRRIPIAAGLAVMVPPPLRPPPERHRTPMPGATDKPPQRLPDCVPVHIQSRLRMRTDARKPHPRPSSIPLRRRSVWHPAHGQLCRRLEWFRHHQRDRWQRPPYGYAWTPNVSTTASASNLAAGTYTVRVTDANNCEAYVSIDITEPSALQTTVSSSDVRCAGSATGQASVQVNGGAGGFSFAWSPGGAINDTLYNASAGSYTVTITDANGCTRSATAIVGSPSPIGLSFNATPASCNGGSDGQIILTASGGTGTLHYSWAGSSDTGFVRLALSAGIYSCTVTDANGCTQTGSAGNGTFQTGSVVSRYSVRIVRITTDRLRYSTGGTGTIRIHGFLPEAMPLRQADSLQEIISLL